MENEILKINILSIAISGLLMLAAGVILYYFKDYLTGNIRFFLPIPPIGVAAYIFAFNMFKHFDCNVPGRATMISEMLLATLTSSFFFFVFTAILILLIKFLKDI